MKLWERVIDICICIRELISIYVREIYNKGNSSYETYDGKLQARKRDLTMIFIDLKKAYNKVSKEVLFSGQCQRSAFPKNTLIQCKICIEK